MLLRANFQIGDNVQTYDFIGEQAERNFAEWLVQTAKEEEKFQYLGSQKIYHPVCWRYNDAGQVDFWDGLLPIGEPTLTVKNSDDIVWFFEGYLHMDLGTVAVDDCDVCECPKGWFKQVPDFYDDIAEIAVTEEIEEETPMSAFENWFRTFIEEKDLPVVNWEIEHGDNIHMIDNYDMVEIICELPAENQAQIKSKLVAIDFMNGDVNHFLKYLAEGYIMTNY